MSEWIGVIGALDTAATQMATALPTADDLPEVEDGDEDFYPLVPGCDSSGGELDVGWIDYSDRGPNDVMLSGPITGGWGPGRWHANRRAAYAACVAKYGVDRVKFPRQSEGRWCCLIKNLRAKATEGEV